MAVVGAKLRCALGCAVVCCCQHRDDADVCGAAPPTRPATLSPRNAPLPLRIPRDQPGVHAAAPFDTRLALTGGGCGRCSHSQRHGFERELSDSRLRDEPKRHDS
eukprot:2360114-Rhodomonas_salina.2